MGYKKEVNTPRSTRQLRRKEATPDAHSNLLNFEDNPDLLDFDQSIRITNDTEPNLTKLNFDFKYDTKTAVVPPTDLRKEGIPSSHSKGRRGLRDSTIKNHHDHMADSLPHTVYELYHRKMEKEEKRMANRDKEKIYFEADKLKSDIETLNSLEWTRSLPHMTYVRDVKDVTEMTKKRDLTVKYIETILGKFDSYKKREDRITKRSKLRLREKDLQIYTKVDKYDYMAESATDEEEENMTNEEIKKHRERKLFAKFGPRIKLNLTNGKTLIAEPFKETSVVETRR
ncbi:hypothetical protein WICPIJ_010173 [Wickerhamomyces pijperi]|uniref:Something about silencing protein 4 domain-containing protein n=1 Tax=Wickerhamomyces pijperi TaxID=599730 RepID=A0A9P8PGW8_WICPI|nr:hypothetical protein WICPIJ_010173 [Wickerhamomyces pijperi]